MTTAYYWFNRYPAGSIEVPTNVTPLPVLSAGHVCYYDNGEPVYVQNEAPYHESSKANPTYPTRSGVISHTARRLFNGDIPGAPAGTTTAIFNGEIGPNLPSTFSNHHDGRRPMSALAHIGLHIVDVFAENGVQILAVYNPSYFAHARPSQDHRNAHDLLGRPPAAIIKAHPQDGSSRAEKHAREMGHNWMNYRLATSTDGIYRIDPKEHPDADTYARTLDMQMRACEDTHASPMIWMDEGGGDRTGPTDEEMRRVELYFRAARSIGAEPRTPPGK